MPTTHTRIRRLTRLALLCACGSALSALESLLPPLVPLPGVRVGLSNAATLLALTQGLPAALCVAAFKALTALLLRGGTAAVMSLCGSISAVLVMHLLRRIPAAHISPIGIGIAGATAHNLIQLILAAFLFTPATAMVCAPPMLGIGILTGSLIGFTANILTRTLHLDE